MYDAMRDDAIKPPNPKLSQATDRPVADIQQVAKAQVALLRLLAKAVVERLREEQLAAAPLKPGRRRKAPKTGK